MDTKWRLRSVHALTPAETEVLRLMACGLSYAQIAEIRGSSYSVVQRTHAPAIFSKIGVSSMLQAALYAWRNDIISPNEAWQVMCAVTHRHAEGQQR